MYRDNSTSLQILKQTKRPVKTTFPQKKLWDRYIIQPTPQEQLTI